MTVTLYINGVRVMKATKYDWEKKYSNSVEDTFDGKDISQDPFPEYSVSISRITSFNQNYESILSAAVAENPDGIPIDIYDGGYHASFSGCTMDSQKVTGDPKKRRATDFSFTATGMTETWG